MPNNPEKALTATKAALGHREAQLTRAQENYKAQRKAAYIAHSKQKRAERLSDRERTHADTSFGSTDKRLARADHYTNVAHEFSASAYKHHLNAQTALGKIKRLQQKLNHLHVQASEIEKRLDVVTIKGNKAYGGSDWDRWMAVTLRSVANCSSGTRRNFYSMYGAWDVDHVIIPGEVYGERSDCSSTVTAWAKAAGLPDPNGAEYTGGFTGTLADAHSGWKQVSLDTYLSTNAPGFIIYGAGNGHHTEAKCPSDSDPYRTAGHGSAPVDFGTVYLFGTGEYQRYYLYLPDA